MGVGLGMELKRASFAFAERAEHDAYDAVVEVDGAPKPKWRFRTERFRAAARGDPSDSGTTAAAAVPESGEDHWITVARGPTEDVTDAFGEFTRTWRAPNAGCEDDAAWRAVADAPAPAFSTLVVGDLVPREALDAFEKAGGEVRSA